MGRRAREASDDCDNVGGQSMKHLKLLRDGQTTAGYNWSWSILLQKLHCFLDNNLEKDALMWHENGSQFIVHHEREVRLTQILGLRVCSLYQVLEALNFECLEENHWSYSIHRHRCFVRGNSHKIEQIVNNSNLSAGKDFAMPNIAYSSELNPLEVRLSLPDSQLQSWKVTIAPSALPHPTIDMSEGFFMLERSPVHSSFRECSWSDTLNSSDEQSDHDMDSPLWWSQHSDFSSICTDELSEMDTLSQISAYYG